MDKKKVEDKLEGFNRRIGPEYESTRGQRFKQNIEDVIKTGEVDTAYELIADASAATVMSPDAARGIKVVGGSSKSGKERAEKYKKRNKAIRQRALAYTDQRRPGHSFSWVAACIKKKIENDLKAAVACNAAPEQIDALELDNTASTNTIARLVSEALKQK
ncbi:MAG: hypothetical protein V3U93_05020 [Alphaproteobacteria bacterium]